TRAEEESRGPRKRTKKVTGDAWVEIAMRRERWRLQRHRSLPSSVSTLAVPAAMSCQDRFDRRGQEEHVRTGGEPPAFTRYGTARFIIASEQRDYRATA